MGCSARRYGIPTSSARRGLFLRHSRHEGRTGAARARPAHSENEGSEIRPDKVRGPVRAGRRRDAAAEAGRAAGDGEDVSAASRRTGPDGSVPQELGGRARGGERRDQARQGIEAEKAERVLTEDRSENGGFCDEVVEVVVEVMVDPQGQIDHFRHLGDNFRAAAEPREKVTNVAVVLFDGKGQVFSGEELALGDETVIAFPVIGDEGLAFDADFVEEFLACGVITATKNPGNGSPSNRVIGPPNPEFVSLFFTKCHISSSVTTTSSALSEGSGSLRASSRTQFRTATSLTPRMRAMEQKLTLPMA